MATEYKLSYTASEIDKKLGQIDNLAAKDEIPTKTSQLTNDSGFITGYSETDPTVPSWAKQASKPSYTASEVGALPSTTKIPSKTSDLTNDSGYITGYTETDPTVPAWAKNATKPSYSKGEVGLGNVDNVKQYSASNPPPYPVTSVNNKTGAVTLNASDVGARPSSWTPSYSDVGAEKSGTAAAAVSSHNTNANAHNDIRLLVDGLSSRINALANSTDEDLDQMAEIVAYIKNNKTLIDNVTTSKVNVADIINNLTTNVSNKPLSAAQGVALKALIDALENDKLDASTLSTAISTALAQAKASGEFDGEDGVSATHKWNGTVLTVTSASGTSSADLKGNKGDSGVYMGSVEPTDPNVVVWVNPDGEADGLDYVLTDEEKNEIAEIAADKARLEFVDSIEECIDTKKRYVLPNGHIYAYMLAPPKYKNWLKYATSEYDGTEIFNKDDTPGYKKGLRIGSTGVTFEDENMYLSGYIPVKYQDVIRLKNITINNKSYLVMYNNSGWATSLNANNYLTADEHGVYSYTINGTSWNAMRLSMGEINDASIITVNEEIVSEEIYQWVDTGYSFVTDAYNTKLTTIEETVQTNSERITVIEESISWDGTDDSGAPSQVKESANTVVDAAISRDDTRIFRFIAIADAHHTDNDAAIVASSKELGQAVDEVLRQIGVDFVANLGDITWGSSKSDNATVLAEGKAFNKLVTNSLRGETQIWTEGNHETGMLTNSQIHSLLYSHNKGLIQDSDHWIEGYGYMDFPNQKVRIICLNTNQGPEDVICGMSNDQLKWFAEVALDMSGKTDWSVITMGHHPLSYSAVSLFRYAVETLKAFINGENFSFETNDKFTFGLDYSDKSCQYVGHFHGHAHTYTILPIQRYVSSGVYEEIGAWEICIPNACASRTDQYASTLEDGNYLKRYCVGGMDYNRPKVDGQRTAFTVVTVCLDSMIIYADDYGVGPTDYDRYVYYGEGEKVIYSVTNMLTNATNSNSAASVLEGDAYTATLTANTGYELDTVKITMGGTDVTNTVYSSGVISIPSVTGNIIITAVAKETPVEPVITNLMDMSQRTYVAMDTPQFIEPNQAHEMDYTKCYAAYSTGRRGSYPTGKITYTQDASNNSFTFKVSSGSGYGVEFPVDVQGDKEYALVATAPARFPTVHLIKYNTDTTVNAVSVIHDASYENGNTKTITFTPESGYLYSLLFVIKIVDEDIQLKNISLMEKI